MKQKDLLLKEMRHRIANSLQLIASILLLKAGAVESEETRHHLEDAHDRIMSIATVQQQLTPGELGQEIPIGPYLEGLCKSLAQSMVGGRKPILIEVYTDKGEFSSEEAISFGLITTELIINCIKHAFPDGRKGTVLVTYKAEGESSWVFSVADDGVGMEKAQTRKDGLGTSIITALAHQLKAKLQIKSSSQGTTVSFVHE